MATALAGAVTLVLALMPAPAGAAFAPPPVRHVWLINLENATYSQTFGTPEHDPYLASTLTKQGLVVQQYYATGHNSLDNYLAQVSGQAPTPATQGDLGPDFVPADPVMDTNGQAVGQGAVYPAKVKTLFDQLDAKGLTWKAYMEDLNVDVAKDSGGWCRVANGFVQANDNGSDKYVAKHNAPVYFRSLIDRDGGGYCRARVASTVPLARDLQSVATTPNFSVLSPGILNDGHEDVPLSDYGSADRWLRHYVPMILASPAFRQDGMLIVTFDEAATVIGFSNDPEAVTACCNEQPGPNSPDPGIGGPGGGHVGALILSPYTRAGSVDAPPESVTRTGPGYYNHYSLLRSLEDVFGIDGHLGFAGDSLTYPGPGSFGCDVYTAFAPCAGAGALGAPAKAAPAPPGSSGPVGPRAADGAATWLAPQPTGDDLRAVTCADGSHCVASGEGGTIVTSDDGGTTWTARRSGTARSLAALACPDATHCLAVGDGGAATASADGGRSWSPVATGKTRDLGGVSCPSLSVCFAVGAGGTILRTTSAWGQWSWETQPAPTEDALDGIGCPPSTAPAASLRCFAVGPYQAADESGVQSMLQTSDGGAHWTAADGGFITQRLRSIGCSGATCVGVGDGGAMMTTRDTGQTWTVGNGGLGDSNVLTGVSCGVADSCTVVGDGSRTSEGRHGAGAAFTMSPGQAPTQRKVGITNPLSAVSCAGADLCVAVGQHGTIVRSGDGGQTWNLQSPGSEEPLARVSCSQTNPLCAVDSLQAIYGLTCQAAGPCLGVGSNGAILTSTDGFASSKMTHSDSGPASAEPSVKPTTLFGASCATAQHCWAVGSYGTLLFSADAGATWKEQDSAAAGPIRSLFSVSCPAADALAQSGCTAVGSAGTILSTTDGGDHWSTRSSPSGVDLNSVACSSATSCVAVGSLGTILASHDGGATWAARDSHTAAYLAGVSCPTTAVCFAVGANGTALVSGDGGDSWKASPTGVGDQLDAISCTGKRDCMASGSSGTVIVTADAGKSWRPLGTGTARALNAIACNAPTGCIAAGDVGSVLGVSASRRPGRR